MKYLVILIALPIFMYAQTFPRAWTFNYGVSWCDSLWSAKGDSTYYEVPTATGRDTVLSDTSKIYNIRGAFNWISVTVEDSGIGVTDSIHWLIGMIIRNEGGGALGTLWQPLRYKDSSWTTIIDTISNAGWTKTYTSYDPMLKAAELMKIELVNAEWIPLRRTKLYWQAVREK